MADIPPGPAGAVRRPGRPAGLSPQPPVPPAAAPQDVDAGEAVVDISRQGGDMGHLAYVGFAVQNGLIEMGRAPALGNVEGKRLRQLRRRRSGGGVAPGAEGGEQVPVPVKGQIPVHRRPGRPAGLSPQPPVPPAAAPHRGGGRRRPDRRGSGPSGGTPAPRHSVLPPGGGRRNGHDSVTLSSPVSRSMPIFSAAMAAYRWARIRLARDSLASGGRIRRGSPRPMTGQDSKRT